VSKRTDDRTVTAWYEGVEEIPRYHDQICIIENSSDGWKQKVNYCREKGIPYQMVLFDRRFEEKKFDNAVCNVNKTVSPLLT